MLGQVGQEEVAPVDEVQLEALADCRAQDRVLDTLFDWVR